MEKPKSREEILNDTLKFLFMVRKVIVVLKSINTMGRNLEKVGGRLYNCRRKGPL